MPIKQPIPEHVLANRKRLDNAYKAACQAQRQRIEEARLAWRASVNDAVGSRAERAAYVRKFRMQYDTLRDQTFPVAPYLTVDWNLGLENA